MKKFGNAVILCGGKSSRMGYDKSLAKINGEYLIDSLANKLLGIFDDVKLSAIDDEKFKQFDIVVVKDVFTDFWGPEHVGPALAIYSALLQATSEYIFVVACDMPLIDVNHIKKMQELIDNPVHGVIPLNGKFIEPLYGYYSRKSLPYFEEALKNHDFKIKNILKNCDICYASENFSRTFDEDLQMFTNLNYLEDAKNLGEITFE